MSSFEILIRSRDTRRRFGRSWLENQEKFFQRSFCQTVIALDDKTKTHQMFGGVVSDGMDLGEGEKSTGGRRWTRLEELEERRVKDEKTGQRSQAKPLL